MTQYLVTKKDASAFGSVEGTFPVAPDRTVEMPPNAMITAELLAEGIIKPMPAPEEWKAVDESIPAPVPPVEDNDEAVAKAPVRRTRRTQAQ